MKAVPEVNWAVRFWSWAAGAQKGAGLLLGTSGREAIQQSESIFTPVLQGERWSGVVARRPWHLQPSVNCIKTRQTYGCQLQIMFRNKSALTLIQFPRTTFYSILTKRRTYPVYIICTYDLNFTCADKKNQFEIYLPRVALAEGYSILDTLRGTNSNRVWNMPHSRMFKWSTLNTYMYILIQM